MTDIINIYGGPSSGKSTTAAALFSLMKMEGRKVELVREITKEWAWMGRPVANIDEFYIFGEQSRREAELLGKVDYLVTDRPLLMSAAYASMYAPKNVEEALEACVLARNALLDADHRQYHFLLRRTSEYKQEGRYETEEQAKQVDVLCEALLHKLGFSCVVVDAPKGGPAATIILDAISV